MRACADIRAGRHYKRTPRTHLADANTVLFDFHTCIYSHYKIFCVLVALVLRFTFEVEGEETASAYELFPTAQVVLVAAQVVTAVTTDPLPTVATVAAQAQALLVWAGRAFAQAVIIIRDWQCLRAAVASGKIATSEKLVQAQSSRVEWQCTGIVLSRHSSSAERGRSVL